MKQYFLFSVIAVSLSFVASAQTAPTLTATSNPSAGDVHIVYNTDTIVVTGPAVNTTWHYDTLHVLSTDTTLSAACSASAYCSSFPGSDIYSYNASSPGTPSFYHISPAAMSFEGGYNTTVLYYDNPEDFLRYPFTFGSVFTDTFDCVFSSAGYTYHRVGTILVKADSWGTLYLPGGITYPNVLRVKSIEVFNDTTIAGGSSYVWWYDGISYTWLVPDQRLEVLATAVTRRQGVPISNAHYFTRPSATAVANTQASDVAIALYPNPAIDEVHIKRDHPFEAGAHADVYSMDGRQMGSYPLKNNDVMVSTRQWTPGVYLCVVREPGRAAFAGKIVIR